MRGIGRVALRVAAGYLALLCLMAGIGLLGVRGISDAAMVAMELQLHPFTVINAVGDAERGVTLIGNQILESLLYPDLAQQGGLAESTVETAAKVDAEIAVVAERYLGPQADVRTLQNSWNRWKARAAELAAAIDHGDIDDSRRLYYDRGAAEFAAAVGACRPILDYARTKSWVFVNASADSRDALTAMVWRLLAGALLLGMTVALVITRGITRPLAKLRRAITRLGQGALAIAVPETHRTDEIGEIAHTLEAFRRTLLEKKLLELKYLTVFNSCPDVIVVTDRQSGIFIEVNNAFESVTGFTRQEVVGRSGLDIGLWDSARQRARLLESLGDAPRLLNHETSLHRKNGEMFTALLSVEAVTLASGASLIFVVRDISGRKREEDLLRRTVAELEQSNAMLERFAHAAAHDLQEPCRTVCSFSQLLERDYGPALSGAGLEYLSFITNAAQRLRNLVKGLLTYSQTRHNQLVFTAVDMGEALAAALGDVADLQRATGAAVACGPMPTAQGDGGQLRLLLAALVSNAMKFHKPGQAPQISVSAEQSNGEWVFTVDDNGVGVEPEYAHKIFEAFQRLHSHSQYPGAGIGLALARRIVDSHGGRIWVESQPGEGSSFRFTLPCNAPAEQAK